MALSVEEGKARRLAGMERAKSEMTKVQKIYRGLVNGRPPASEFKTPISAVAAARTLHRDIEARMVAEGLKPLPGDWGVTAGYITPDLTTIGATVLYAPEEESGLIKHLTGNIVLGTVFGMVDQESDGTIVLGARPFFAMKQAEGWLEELRFSVRLAIEDELRSRS